MSRETFHRQGSTGWGERAVKLGTETIVTSSTEKGTDPL